MHSRQKWLGAAIADERAETVTAGRDRQDLSHPDIKEGDRMKVIKEQDLEKYLSDKINQVIGTINSPTKFYLISNLAVISNELNSVKFDIEERMSAGEGK